MLPSQVILENYRYHHLLALLTQIYDLNEEGRINYTEICHLFYNRHESKTPYAPHNKSTACIPI